MHTLRESHAQLVDAILPWGLSIRGRQYHLACFIGPILGQQKPSLLLVHVKTYVGLSRNADLPCHQVECRVCLFLRSGIEALEDINNRRELDHQEKEGKKWWRRLHMHGNSCPSVIKTTSHHATTSTAPRPFGHFSCVLTSLVQKAEASGDTSEHRPLQDKARQRHAISKMKARRLTYG